MMGQRPHQSMLPPLAARHRAAFFVRRPGTNRPLASQLTALFDSEAAPLRFQLGGFFLQGLEKDQRHTSLRVIGMVASLLMGGIPIPMELSRSAHLRGGFFCVTGWNYVLPD